MGGGGGGADGKDKWIFAGSSICSCSKGCFLFVFAWEVASSRSRRAPMKRTKRAEFICRKKKLRNSIRSTPVSETVVSMNELSEKLWANRKIANSNHSDWGFFEPRKKEGFRGWWLPVWFCGRVRRCYYLHYTALHCWLPGHATARDWKGNLDEVCSPRKVKIYLLHATTTVVVIMQF